MKNIEMRYLITVIFSFLIICGASAQVEDNDSLRIKIGQMIMVGFSGTEVNDSDPILEEIATSHPH